MHKVTNMLIDDIKDYIDKNKPMTKDKWAYLKPYLDELQSCMTILAMMGEDLEGNKVDYSGMMDEMGEMTSGTYPYYRQSGNNRMMNPDLMYSHRGRSMKNNGSYKGMNGSSQRRYSMNGYSGHDGNTAMLNSLYEAMEMAQNDEERQNIQNLINKLEY